MISEWLMQPLWGGNVIGIIFGGLFSSIGVAIFVWVCWRDFFKSDELTDAEFMSISLENMDAEDDFRAALEKDDQYD